MSSLDDDDSRRREESFDVLTRQSEELLVEVGRPRELVPRET